MSAGGGLAQQRAQREVADMTATVAPERHEAVTGVRQKTDCIAGVKYITEFPPDEPIVAMNEFNGRMYLATCRRIFLIQDDEAQQLNIRLLEVTAYPADGS